jgi:hypothetical protein
MCIRDALQAGYTLAIVEAMIAAASASMMIAGVKTMFAM